MALRPALAGDRGERCKEILHQWVMEGQVGKLWCLTAFLQGHAAAAVERGAGKGSRALGEDKTLCRAVCMVVKLVLKD